MGASSSIIHLNIILNNTESHQQIPLSLEVKESKTLDELKTLIAKQSSYKKEHLIFTEPNPGSFGKGEQTKLKHIKDSFSTILVSYNPRGNPTNRPDTGDDFTMPLPNSSSLSSRSSTSDSQPAPKLNYTPLPVLKNRSQVFLPEIEMSPDIKNFSKEQIQTLLDFLETTAELQVGKPASVERIKQLPHRGAGFPIFTVGSLYAALRRAFLSGRVSVIFVDAGGTTEAQFAEEVLSSEAMRELIARACVLYCTCAVRGPALSRVPSSSFTPLKAHLRPIVPSVILAGALGGVLRVLSVTSLRESVRVPGVDEYFASACSAVDAFAAQKEAVLAGGVTLKEALGLGGYFGGECESSCSSSYSSTSDLIPPSTPLVDEEALEEERRIREDENAEYDLSVAIDQAKELSRRDEEERQLRLAQQAALEEEEMQRKKREQKLDKERKKEAKCARTKEFAQKNYVEEATQETLTEALAAFSANNSENNSENNTKVAPVLCTLQLRFPPPLPARTRHFLSTHCIANVKAVAYTLAEELHGKEIRIVSFPRRIAEDEETLAEAGLVPRSSVIVEVDQEEDEEEEEEEEEQNDNIKEADAPSG